VKRFVALSALALYALLASSCMNAYRKSVGATQDQVYTRIYITSFNVAWQATLDSLKNSPLDPVIKIRMIGSPSAICRPQLVARHRQR
jgi:PBP1b-binding outer membrane lipoprotein LpoB